MSVPGESEVRKVGRADVEAIESSTVTRRSDVHGEIKNRMNLGNGCYSIIQSISSAVASSGTYRFLMRH
jgi:hypothetical protein